MRDKTEADEPGQAANVQMPDHPANGTTSLRRIHRLLIILRAYCPRHRRNRAVLIHCGNSHADAFGHS
jgi:hypothetical protein